MWKSFSIKTQLILIMLIPLLALIYMTVLNINESIESYNQIEDSLETVNNIAKLSQGRAEISIERGYLNYSTYDRSKLKRFSIEKQRTLDWFSKVHFKDTVILKNLKRTLDSLLELQLRIEYHKETGESAHVKYVNLNKTLNNLIKREIVLCPTAKLAQLGSNYYNATILREGILLRRGVILQKIINTQNHRNLDSSVLETYYKAKSDEEYVHFQLKNFKINAVDRNLIAYMNSKEIKDFYIESEAIIQNKSTTSPVLWWNESTAIATHFRNLEKKNLDFITDYANKEKESTLHLIVFTIAVLLLFVCTAIVLVYIMIRNLSRSLYSISASIQKIAIGEIIDDIKISDNAEFAQISTSFNDLLETEREHIDLATKIISGDLGSTIRVRSDKDVLNKSLNSMSLELRRLREESNETRLMEKNVVEISQTIIDSKDLYEFGGNICNIIVKQTQGCQANFYVLEETEEKKVLRKIGGYAEDKNTPNVIAIGEGLVGEVAKTKQQQCLNNLPNGYSYVASSLGKSACYNVLITPVTYKNRVIGVIEIGSLENFDDKHEKLLNLASDSIGSAIEIFMRNEELLLSLEEINQKNNSLQAQEEELRQSNEELNRQTLLLQQSEEELRNQAAELEQTNAYLEDKGRELESMNNEVVVKNSKLLTAQEELNSKAEEVAKSSKYKSEFLANMSHELRTPLNSILILSDLLKENGGGNLNEHQIDNLSVINSSGKDLLNLINDILDISKIEAGKVDVFCEESIVERIYSDMEGLFRVQMQKKNIEFTATISDDCPKKLNTDIGKLEQILKNFLSNALKFTPENGKVSVLFSSGQGKSDFNSTSLSKKKRIALNRINLHLDCLL